MFLKPGTIVPFLVEDEMLKLGAIFSKKASVSQTIRVTDLLPLATKCEIGVTQRVCTNALPTV
jgi:hypothetical protein